MAMHAIRSDLIRAEAAAIRRYATVAAIKRRALDPEPILDDPREPRPRKKKPRVIFVVARETRPAAAGLHVPARTMTEPICRQLRKWC
jgi:hypothetical protein